MSNRTSKSVSSSPKKKNNSKVEEKSRSKSTTKKKVSSKKEVRQNGEQQELSNVYFDNQTPTKLKLTNESLLNVSNTQLLQQQDLFLNQKTTLERKAEITRTFGPNSIAFLDEQHKWSSLLGTLDLTKDSKQTSPKKSVAKIPAKSKMKQIQTTNSSDLENEEHIYAADSKMNSKIALIQSDIAKLFVDAIVCSTSESMINYSSSKNVTIRGGERLQTELNVCKQKLAPLSGGKAFMTCGYELPAHYIIWACVTNDSHLAEAYKNALDLASNYSLKSIAFMCLGTGGIGISQNVGSKIALKTIREWLNVDNNAERIDLITFCAFKDTDYKAYLSNVPHYFPPGTTEKNSSPSKDSSPQSVTLTHETVQPSSLAARLTSGKQFDKCTSLDISQAANSVSDWFFFAVQKFAEKLLSQIQSLNLVGSEITDTSIFLIAQQCSKLRELAIDGCFLVTEQSICYLLEKRSLKKLSAYGCPIRLLPSKTRQKFNVVTGIEENTKGTENEEQNKNKVERSAKGSLANNYLKIAIPRTGSTDKKVGAESVASHFGASNSKPKFKGILDIMHASGQMSFNIFECDISLLHMFTGPRSITLLTDSNKNAHATRQAIVTSLNNSAIGLMLATSSDATKLFNELQSTIKETANNAWHDLSTWIFADKKNAESITNIDFQKKFLVAESGIEKAVSLLQSSKFTEILKEDLSSSELPKDIEKLIEKEQKGAKVAKGKPQSSDLFALEISGHIVFLPYTNWYFKDLNFMEMLFNNLYKIKNGTKERRQKVPWLAISDRAFAITDLIDIVRQKSGLNDIEEETMWPSSPRQDEQELVINYRLPYSPCVPSMLNIFQAICDIALPTTVWRDGIVANHFCCDIFCQLVPSENEKSQCQLKLSVRTLSIGESAVCANGESNLKALLAETLRLCRQIVESALIKFKVYFKVAEQNFPVDKDGINDKGRYYTLSCTHENMETGIYVSPASGEHPKRLFYNNSQCALCEAIPTRWNMYTHYCTSCGLCESCIKRLKIQSTILNLVPVENVKIIQNADKQFTAIEVFFERIENGPISDFAIQILNDEDHVVIKFFGWFFDPRQLRTRQTKQIIGNESYSSEIQLQWSNKLKDEDIVVVEKNLISSTTKSATIVLTSSAARVLLRTAATKPKVRNSYLQTGMVLEYCEETYVEAQLAPKVYAAIVMDIAPVNGFLILNLFEIENRYQFKLVKEQINIDLMHSDLVHPIGWAEHNNLPIAGSEVDPFDWLYLLTHTTFIPVPFAFFSETQIENCPDYLKHKLKYIDDDYSESAPTWCPGMRLEAVDRANPTLICVATVSKVERNEVTITFDGWNESYDYTAKSSTDEFHPIGYCDFVKHPSGLYKPQGYTAEFDWLKYLNEIKAPPVPYELFSEIQKQGTPKHIAFSYSIDFFSGEETLKTTVETWKPLMPTIIDQSISMTCNVICTTSPKHGQPGGSGFFLAPTELSYLYQTGVLFDRHVAQNITEGEKYFCHYFENQNEPMIELTNVPMADFMAKESQKSKKQPRANVDNFLSQLLVCALPINWKRICEIGFSGLVASEENDLVTNLIMLESINRSLRTLANTFLCLHFDNLSQILSKDNDTETLWQSVMTAVTTKYGERDRARETAIYSPLRDLNVRFKHPGENDSDNTFDLLHLGFMPQLLATADENRSKAPQMGIDIDPKYNPEYLKSLQFSETLSIRNLSYWTEIVATPAYWNHRLTRIEISNVPLYNFPEAICKCENLIYLSLNRTAIDSISENIGNLLFLNELELDFNRISDLPTSLKKTKLETLSVRATESYNDHSVVLQEFPYQYFSDYYHPFCQGLTRDDNMRMRVNRDLNKPGRNPAFVNLDSGIVEGENLQILNLYLNEAFPRFKSIPSVVFELTHLRSLQLTDQNLITEIPHQIANLVNLNILSLNQCTSLEIISEQVGRCPLELISVQGCQALRTPPQEVVRRGSAKIIAYLRRLLRGFEVCKRTKLMMVGLGGAGKTSLVRALISNQYQSEGTSNEEITDGIDIAEWNVRVPSPITPGKNETINYSIWDFAGQAVYYNSHQFFLSNRAVYFLLWNTRLGYEHAGLDFWLSSIACHAPLAPIFVIGTHADQVFNADLPMQDLQETFPQIAHFCHISVLTGQGVKELADKLFDITLRQSYMGEKVPSDWLLFEKGMLEKRDEKVVPFEDIQREAINSKLMLDSQDVKECLTLLHELGSVQYFNNDLLRDQVIVNPQWLVDVMACLITVKENVIQNGRFKRKNVKTIWAKYPEKLHKWLLQLTEEFDLTYALPTEKINIVPCLLPEEEPEYDWPEISDDETQEMKLSYQFKYLPAGLFNRAQSRLCQYSDNAAIWKKGSILHKNRHIALLRQTKDQELVLIVQGPKPENVLFLVHEVLETLITEFFRGVNYDLSIPCIDCVRTGSQDPHMFASKNVKRALDLKAPFLQCTKHFHIVAIDALTDLLPPSTTADYEKHITNMLHQLKELSSANATGQILVLCHSLDAQSKRKELVTAKRLCASLTDRKVDSSRLEIAGKQSQVELGTKLSSCQAIVVVISEQFCKDQSCADIFSYVKRNVQRPFICVVIAADDQQWRDTNVGAVVSTEMYVNLNSTERYDDKLDELLYRIKSKAQLSSQKKTEEFDVFISYCWSNSKDAVSKGIKEVPGGLGQVDPREFYDFLEKNRIRAWLDVKCAREGAIFEEIADALRMSKVVLVCVSDEYLKSKNCMMEFRFAVGTLQRPLVLCVVGTGQMWQNSEVTMLALTSPRIDFQTRIENYFNALLKIVGETLRVNKIDKQNTQKKKSKASQRAKSTSYQNETNPNKERRRRKSEDNDTKEARKKNKTVPPAMPPPMASEGPLASGPLGPPAAMPPAKPRSMPRANSLDSVTPSAARKRRGNEKSLDDNINTKSSKLKSNMEAANSHSAYEELCELAQRKFLQQCTQVADELKSTGLLPFPHLIFLDCTKLKSVTERPSQSGVGRGSSSRIEEIFEQVGLTKDSGCIRFLCEYDEGWHISGGSYALPNDAVLADILGTSCVYLAALYSILQYSPVAVNILEDKEKSVDFITSLKRYAIDNNQTDFKDSFFQLNAMAHITSVQGKLFDDNIEKTSENASSAQPGHGLNWYHTHSRKKLWLCKQHAKFARGLVDADLRPQKLTVNQALTINNRSNIAKSSKRMKVTNKKVPNNEISLSEVPKPTVMKNKANLSLTKKNETDSSKAEKEDKQAKKITNTEVTKMKRSRSSEEIENKSTAKKEPKHNATAARELRAKANNELTDKIKTSKAVPVNNNGTKAENGSVAAKKKKTIGASEAST